MSSTLSEPGYLPAATHTGLSAAALAAIEAGVPDSTRAAYKADWARFTTWCQQYGRDPLPASAETLTEYTTYLAYEAVPARWAAKRTAGEDTLRGLTPNAIERSRAAIFKMHRLARLTPPDSEGAKAVVKGYRAMLARSHDPRSRPSKALPLTPELLTQIINAVPADTLKGKRDRALLAIGYTIAARSEELVALNIEDLEFRDEGLLVKVYRSKTRHDGEVRVPHDYAPLAIRITREYLAALAALGRTSGALFLRIFKGFKDERHLGHAVRRRNGPVGNPDGRISAQNVSLILKMYAPIAGVEGKITSHGMRRGMATASARAGNSRKAIAAQGGWDEDGRSLSGYIEEGIGWTENALRGAGI